MGYAREGSRARSREQRAPDESDHPSPRLAPELHHRGIYEAVAKPFFDRTIGITMTILTFPLVLGLLTGIWFTIGTPGIYKQRRVGRFGGEFTVYKLRTMRDDRRANVVPIDHNERRINHKSPDDPRHVPYGRFLRKWSLDEIPQFWNVALGQMSVVGPRPELPQIVVKYEDWQHLRHEVKPGLTGLWQITERGNVPMHEATDIDVEYAEDVTFLGDVKILIHTPAAVLGGRVGN
ncbi:MAG: sugar transferase [Acidimicrobiia bacterium]